MCDELYAVAHLGYLGEHRGAAARHQKVCRIAGSGVRRDTGEGIGAAALHAHQKIGKGQLLPLSLVQNLKLLLRHFQNGIHHVLVSLMLLQDNDIFRGIQLRPPLAEALRCELLTAQSHQHEHAAEIRMHGDVPDDALGHLGLRGIDGHAAAVLMIHSDDVIHIGILGQNLVLDALDGHIQHTGHALHGGIDAENVPGAAVAAVRVPVAEPGGALGLRQIRHDIRAKFHGIQIRCRCHHQVFLVDPAALRHVLTGGAQNHAVADDLGALRAVRQRNLMGLGDVTDRYNAGEHLCALRNIMDGNGNIVLLIDLNT